MKNKNKNKKINFSRKQPMRPNTNAFKDKDGRWRIQRKGYKSGILMFNKNGKQIRKQMRTILRGDYLSVKLPENMLWVPDGGKHYNGFLVRKKSKFIDARGNLRGKYDCSYTYEGGYLHPLNVHDNKRCSRQDKLGDSNMYGIIDTHFTKGKNTHL